MPIISVIVPAYNSEQTILETIESVLQQTFSDFELIVINDGSTDRTLELLNTVKDPRLKIFSYPNAGVSVARNRGITHTSGDFIAFLDHDDLWTSDKFEVQLAALQQHPEAGLVYSWAYYMDEKGESFYADKSIFIEGNVYEQLLVRDFIASGSSCLIRRQAIESVGEFDPSVPGVDDWDYWIRLAAHWHFVVVPKGQVFFRQSLGSQSSKKVEIMEKNMLRVVEKAFQSAPPEMQYLKNQSLANTYTYLAYKYWARAESADETKQAAQKLWMAIRLYPPILLDSWARNLFIKLLLIQFFPPQLSRHLLQFVSKLRSTLHPIKQQSRT
jgi:GT2 family glycosyltransferase